MTSVDRLKADPFAFYAQAVLGVRRLDSVDADHSAAWKGTAVHAVLEQWLRDDNCDPDKLVDRARALLASETIHPMLRALWQPRLMEAIRWIEEQELANQAEGRLPRNCAARRRSATWCFTARPTASTGSATAILRSSITRPGRPPRKRPSMPDFRFSWDCSA